MTLNELRKARMSARNQLCDAENESKRKDAARFLERTTRLIKQYHRSLKI